ncbi:unnamed protein product, partial [Rotaria magnacalcarata]
PDDEIYSFHLNLCFHFSSGIYHYQFKVVTESWFEQELEPALPENKYDEDKTVKVVDEYEWKYDNHVPLVLNENLIIYELHIGDFEDKIANVTAKVDYLVKLDVIAVEIMPINEFLGHIGWGYTPRYHFAIQIEDREDNSYAINKEQLQFYKDAIQLRKSNAALTSPNFEFIFEDENNFILAWHRRISSTPDTH